MATVKFLAGFICLAFIGRDWGIGCGVITTTACAELVSVSSRTNVRELLFVHSPRGVSYRRHDDKLSINTNKEKYENIIRIARKEIGVRETNCQNCGGAVARYLAYVGFKTPQPWCAALVSYVFKEAGYNQPRTAWSPALFPKEKLVRYGLKDLSYRRNDSQGSVLQRHDGKALVYGIYFASLGRIAHCGILESVQGDFLQGIEGNTSAAGLREGDGVWRKIRHKRTIARYADWIKE